jgi:hypothetical protein
MKLLNPNKPLWLYKLSEYLLLFDGKTEEERITAYRYGWHIFSQNKHHFEDFSKLVVRRKWFIYLCLIYPIVFTAMSLLLALSILTIELWMKLPLAIAFSGITAVIIYSLIGHTLKNIRETKIFLNYVNPTTKAANFREFESLGFNDLEGAETFYENMRAKKDYSPIQDINAKLDKTEKLLAIDFLLGKPGALNEHINKLCLDPHCNLTKEGIYRVMGEVLSASPHNIKKDITRGIEEIRHAENLSTKRVAQLINIKEVFTHSKLIEKANEIDKLIYNKEQAKREPKTCAN